MPKYIVVAIVRKMLRFNEEFSIRIFDGGSPVLWKFDTLQLESLLKFE